MTKLQYPTDLTDAQWQILKPFFRKKSNRGRKVVYERRLVVNAILYGSSEKFCNTASKENASHETWSLCHTLELSAC